MEAEPRSLPTIITPASDAVYALHVTADGTEVRLDCLGSKASALLITTLQQMERALAGLLAHDGSELFIGGEFDVVPNGYDALVMRMAVLSLYVPQAGRTILLHFASLFAPFETSNGHYDPPEGLLGLAPLVKLMRTERLRRTWWGGDASDAHTLLCALPCLAPLGPVQDLQLEMRALVQAGVLPPGTPFSLAGICAHGLGARLDKSEQCADWHTLPSAKMIAYAAGDVLVLERLALALESGELARKLRVAAPRLVESIAGMGAQQRAVGNYVSGLQDYVTALNGSTVVYADLLRAGQAHAPMFTVSVSAHGLGSGVIGTGSKKKAAKAAAARAACMAWIPGEGGAGLALALESGELARKLRVAAPRLVESIAGMGAQQRAVGNYVSGLQEYVTALNGSTVVYADLLRAGQAHAPMFTVSVSAHGLGSGVIGTGSKKKAAKAAAARAACMAWIPGEGGAAGA